MGNIKRLFIEPSRSVCIVPAIQQVDRTVPHAEVVADEVIGSIPYLVLWILLYCLFRIPH